MDIKGKITVKFDKSDIEEMVKSHLADKGYKMDSIDFNVKKYEKSQDRMHHTTTYKFESIDCEVERKI